MSKSKAENIASTTSARGLLLVVEVSIVSRIQLECRWSVMFIQFNTRDMLERAASTRRGISRAVPVEMQFPSRQCLLVIRRLSCDSRHGSIFSHPYYPLLHFGLKFLEISILPGYTKVSLPVYLGLRSWSANGNAGLQTVGQG